VVPRSSARQRRRPSPESSRGQRRPQTPQRCFSRDLGRTDTTIASSSTRTSSTTARSTPSTIFHTILGRTSHRSFRRFLTLRSRNPRNTAACAPRSQHKSGAPAPDLAAKQRGPTALSSSANPLQSIATTRGPPPPAEALLDRRRLAALPRQPPHLTPGNSTSATFSRMAACNPLSVELRMVHHLGGPRYGTVLTTIPCPVGEASTSKPNSRPSLSATARIASASRNP